jgi:HAD superfamily phosphoserine phosphatase-like hydrolase
MNGTQFNPHRPNGFSVADAGKVNDKLERFARAGISRTHFVFDFDHTLTISNVGTWQLLYGLLPADGQKVSQATRTKYLAIEAAGGLSPDDARTWLASELDLHTMHGTNLQRIKEAAKAITLRDGTKELFDLCAQSDLPTIILSAGIHDVIDLILHEHDIKPTVVMSIKLHFSDSGDVIGWDSASMVNPHNKHETPNETFSHLRTERPYTILVGDTVADVAMAKGDENVLRIRICDPADETSLPAYLKQSFDAGYDLVLQHNFEPLIALVQWLSSKK